MLQELQNLLLKCRQKHQDFIQEHKQTLARHHFGEGGWGVGETNGIIVDLESENNF